jgi:predicted ABC-type transport system involved in lysophospholipase L1 biosynthesis ATPase subunit
MTVTESLPNGESIRLEHLSKSIQQSPSTRIVLRDVSTTFRGEFVAIVGESGSREQNDVLDINALVSEN